MSCPIQRNKRNARICAVWDHLDAVGPATAAEMAKAMGVSRHAVTGSITRYREEHPGVFLVFAWSRYCREETGRAGGGKMAPVWGIGDEPDVKMPARKSPKKSCAAYYDRNKAEILVKQAARRRKAGRTERTPVWLRGLV